MPWFRIDDGFYDHPKVDELSLEAVGLWALCGAYCAKQVTDGYVSAQRVTRFGGTEQAAGELVNSGLWTVEEKGFRFHDWTDHQPTRDEIEAKREQARQRQKRKRQRDALGQYVTEAVTSPEVTPPSQRDTSVSNGVSHSTPDPTRPVPARPEEKPLSSDAAASDPEFPESVIDLCEHLASKIRDNGNKVGTVGKTWHLAMDRLIRLDHHTPELVREVIDWSQADEFWQGNILSAPKLREKFDTLKSRRLNDRAKANPTPGPGLPHVPPAYRSFN